MARSRSIDSTGTGVESVRLVCASVGPLGSGVRARQRTSSRQPRHPSPTFPPPFPPHAVRTSVAGGAARLCEQAAGDGEPHPLPRVSFRPAEGGRAVCAGGGARPQTGGERKGWGWGGGGWGLGVGGGLPCSGGLQGPSEHGPCRAAGNGRAPEAGGGGLGRCGGEGGAGRGADRGVRGGRSAALGVRAAATTGPDSGSGTAANVLCRPAEHFCRPAEVFGRPAEHFCRPAEVSGRPAEDICRPAEVSGRPAEDICRPAEVFGEPAELFCRPAEVFCWPAICSVRPSRKCRCSANAAGSGGQLRGKHGETPRKFKVQVRKGSMRRGRRRGWVSIGLGTDGREDLSSILPHFPMGEVASPRAGGGMTRRSGRDPGV